MSERFWQTKLHARLHDPAEKALVLLRDPAGHEGGTSRALHRDLGFAAIGVDAQLDPDNAEVLDRVLFKQGVPADMYRLVKRADWWAAGADRPQWPLQEIQVSTAAGQHSFKVADWAQVRWSKQPVLVHPLTGQVFDLGSLAETDIGDIKRRSFEHFSALTQKQPDGSIDPRRTLFAYWRFGPELAESRDAGSLGLLWPHLPADTRVPDHSIWDHLDLTSAFAGAFAADPEGDVALLSMALGPVQGFIAAARSTSDLWAGSHLLSRLAWEAIKPICEALGPDAVLFPRLRGVPQVDVWLRDELGLPAELFEGLPWTRLGSDANPLFAAALPNRFVAAVPASQAAALAEKVQQRVQRFLAGVGEQVVGRLLACAGQSSDPVFHAWAQMREQLGDFPELHWAAVPFSLVGLADADKQAGLDTARLQTALAAFEGADADAAAGFLASEAWQVLRQDIQWGDGTTFFAPKPGLLYPAIHELAERTLAAAKSLRPFQAYAAEGWRDSASGEVEPLCLRSSDLGTRQGPQSLWGKVHAARPAWARKGEQLGALAAIKRLWPSLFAEEVARALGQDGAAARFVVSTHTMALAHPLEHWLKAGAPGAERFEAAHADVLRRTESTALPRRLRNQFGKPGYELARKLPALLEADDAHDEADEVQSATPLRSRVRELLAADAGLETYYALLLMDGDHMGRLLAGDPETAIRYRDSFHPRVRAGFDAQAEHHPRLRAYGEAKRALSPGRHFALSGALNDFALQVVPEVVEREFAGRVLYAGGDDVFAMLPVADVLQAALRLRRAYSGSDPDDAVLDWSGLRGRDRMVCKQGFAWLRGRLLRLMGERATASAGLVIAHHQAPLGTVRRELAAAERRAKSEGGRDAFSISLVKRAGGIVRFTGKWPALELLRRMRDFLRAPGVSRRAVYNTLQWLHDLPSQPPQEMLRDLLRLQMGRQSSKAAAEAHALPELCATLASHSLAQSDWCRHLAALLQVAEFIARETRSLGARSDTAAKQEARA